VGVGNVLESQPKMLTFKWEKNIRKTVLVVPRHLPKTGVKAEKIFEKKIFFSIFLIFFGGCRKVLGPSDMES